jgi:hypothetical protein
MEILKPLFSIAIILSLTIGCNSTTFQSDENLMNSDGIVLSYYAQCFQPSTDVNYQFIVSDIDKCFKLQEITKKELGNISYTLKFMVADDLFVLIMQLSQENPKDRRENKRWFYIISPPEKKSLIEYRNQISKLVNDLDSKPHKALASYIDGDCFNAMFNYKLYINELQENLHLDIHRGLNKKYIVYRTNYLKELLENMLKDICDMKNLHNDIK